MKNWADWNFGYLTHQKGMCRKCPGLSSISRMFYLIDVGYKSGELWGFWETPDDCMHVPRLPVCKNLFVFVKSRKAGFRRSWPAARRCGAYSWPAGIPSLYPVFLSIKWGGESLCMSSKILILSSLEKFCHLSIFSGYFKWSPLRKIQMLFRIWKALRCPTGNYNPDSSLDQIVHSGNVGSDCVWATSISKMSHVHVSSLPLGWPTGICSIQGWPHGLSHGPPAEHGNWALARRESGPTRVGAWVLWQIEVLMSLTSDG